MASPSIAPLRFARLLGLLSVVTYNWWVGAALAGLVTSPDGMFSDLEATGVRHAHIFERLDIASGILVCVGLLILRAPADHDRRREWWLLIAFGLSGIIGGLFPYACPEGKNDLCRDAEWHFELPLHHYIHMVSGIFEFAFATIAIICMWRRLRAAAESAWRRTGELLALGLVVGYPALALSYLTDRWDAPVEAFFFVLFAVLVGAAFLEPREQDQPRTERARSTSSPIAASSSSTESNRSMPRKRSTKATSTSRS